MGFAVGGAEPSAPPTAPSAPPTAPPSYEEAVGNIANNPASSTNPPYPVGEPSMPRPFCTYCNSGFVVLHYPSNLVALRSRQ